jgi:hypothetical protein
MGDTPGQFSRPLQLAVSWLIDFFSIGQSANRAVDKHRASVASQ